MAVITCQENTIVKKLEESKFCLDLQVDVLWMQFGIKVKLEAFP